MKKKENDKSLTKKNSIPRIYNQYFVTNNQKGFLAPTPREGVDSEEEGSGSYDNYRVRIHGARNKSEINLSGAYQSDENLLQNGELTAKVFIANASTSITNFVVVTKRLRHRKSYRGRIRETTNKTSDIPCWLSRDGAQDRCRLGESTSVRSGGIKTFIVKAYLNR